MRGYIAGRLSRSLIFSVLGIAAGYLLATPSVVAQTGASGGLEEIVVMSRRREENLQEVPDTIVALNADLIERANINMVRDITARIPNVSIEESLSPTSTFIAVRGVVSTRNGEPAVAMVVDGVQIGSSTEVSRAFHDVERIEVLKGPQGALYGRNAIGGAILITTKEPTDEVSGRVRASIGNKDFYEFDGALSGPIADNWKFRLSGNFRDFKGTIVNEYINELIGGAAISSAVNLADNDAAYTDFETNKDLRARLTWEPNDRASVALDVSHSDLETGAYWYAPIVRLEDSTVTFPIGNDVNSVAFRDLTNAWLKVDVDLDFATLTSLSAYTETDERYGVPYEGRGSNQMGDVDFYNTTFVNRVLPTLSAADQALLSSALQGVGSHNFYDVENFSQEFRFVSPSDQRLRWVGGLYLLLTERSDTIRADLVVPPSPPLEARQSNGLPGVTDAFLGGSTSGLIFETSNTQDNTAWAAFFNADFDLTDNLTLTAAVRYDEDEREITRLDGPTINTGGNGIGSSVFGAECTIGVAGCVPRGTVEEETWDAFQPKVSLAWKPTDDALLYGTFARGFRSGGFNAAGATLADRYREETVDSFEIGAKTTWLDGRLRINAAAFFMDYEDAQVFEFDGQIFVQSLYNIPESEIYGFEASLDWAILDSLTISAGLGLLESEITKFDSDIRDNLEAALRAAITNTVPLTPDTEAAFNDNFKGRNLPKFPHTSVNLSAFFDRDVQLFGGSRLLAQIDYRTFGDRYWWIDNTDEEDFEHIVDGNIGLELQENWLARLWCKNCFDTDYRFSYEPAEMVLFSGPSKDIEYAARGRTWGVSLQYSF